jgi:hypothetical protein
MRLTNGWKIRYLANTSSTATMKVLTKAMALKVIYKDCTNNFINFLTAIDLTGREFIIDQKRSKIKKAISVCIKCKTSFLFY